MPRYVNLVFQGGGMRGIAYAGVLQNLPTDIHIHAVGGTSAGALVAAVLAIGKTPADLTALLRQRELYDLVEEAERERMKRIRRALQQLANLWINQEGHGGQVSTWRTLKYLFSHSTAFVDLKTVWNERGLHQSKRLRGWLDGVLEEKTFSDITVEELKIVAANVSSRRYVIYSKANNLNTPIAEAVHASVSIPIFFAPLQFGPTYLVDGGLLSNFPAFLFAQGEYPTVGFRLQDLVPPVAIDSSLDYLKGLLMTMMEAHDKERGNPPYFNCYTIQTPSSIFPTKFDLSPADVEHLYQCGLDVGRQVDWVAGSSERPVVSFYDPKPHETLEFSLQQAN